MVNDGKSVSWVFVCQSGRLELEACLLATSLRRMLGPDADLIAAIPQPASVMGTVSVEVIRFLECLDVRVEAFTNPMVKEGDTPATELLMNKAFALQVETSASTIVFVDSDQLCDSQVDLTDLTAPLVGRRAFYPGAKATEPAWERAYDLCETEMPTHRIVARSRVVSDPVIVCPPYFNSGFISIDRIWLHRFVENYVDCYRRIASHRLLGKDRYFEEQMAMAIAVIKTQVPYEIDNHRIDRWLFHYYTIPRLASFAKQAQLVRDLADETPDLKKILAADDDWRRLLQGTPVNVRPAGQEGE